MDASTLLRAAADRLDLLSDRATPGEWRMTGLLASRPEIVADRPDGTTEHVAEARAGSGPWIVALSPAVAAPLAAMLRGAADSRPVPDAALDLARVLLGRAP